MKSLSVIVPTYDEAENAQTLVIRLEAALRGLDAEVLFVDDGSDDLPEVVAAMSTDLDVRVLRRDWPTGRLGGAVIEGIRQTTGECVVVCDGDLQHPPELIPAMLQAAHSAELVVASRYTAGGSAAGLASSSRRLVSRGASALAKAFFPRRLARCTDPMSGFFLVRRGAVDWDAVKPKGFKVLLEIVARSPKLRVAEVPFVFGERFHGASHATVREGMLYVQRLAALRMANKAFLFMLVGASGVVPNLLTLLLLTDAKVHYLVASIIAIQVGVVWNFCGSEFLVWRDSGGRRIKRFGLFVLVGETDLVRLPFVVLFVQIFHGHSVTASALTLVAAFFLRFTLADKVVYRSKGRGNAARPVKSASAAGHAEVPHLVR